MDFARRLLPFMTLDKASNVLNEICRSGKISWQFSPEEILALSISGDINLTVVLPNDFLVLQKNQLRYGESPLRPKFPKGTVHCYVNRPTVFSLSLNGTAVLHDVFTFGRDGATDEYRSVEPAMNISLSDIRIKDDELIRLINRLLDRDSESSKKGQRELLPSTNYKPKKQLQKDAILNCLKQLSYDPKNLPARRKGGSGPKAEVRERLLKDRLFTEKTFDKTWEDLRAEKEILGAE